MALDEVQALQGAVDLPDPRDYAAIHILGADTPMVLPPSVNLNKVPSHNQGRTFHCTAYALTHMVEIMNTIEHGARAACDPEEQWGHQLRPPDDLKPGAVEGVGDSLQHALRVFVKLGLDHSTDSEVIEPKTFTASGYAFTDKNLVAFKTWLAKGFPVYTGWNAHCFCLVGYDDAKQVLIAKNSYGPEAGANKDGTFDIHYTDLHKLFSGYIIFDNKDLIMIFKDVSEESPMAKNIQRMRDLGLMKGYGTSTDPLQRLFQPEKPITRAEVAEVLGNFIDKFGLSPKS